MANFPACIKLTNHTAIPHHGDLPMMKSRRHLRKRQDIQAGEQQKLDVEQILQMSEKSRTRSWRIVGSFSRSALSWALRKSLLVDFVAIEQQKSSRETKTSKPLFPETKATFSLEALREKRNGNQKLKLKWFWFRPSGEGKECCCTV